MTIQQRSGVRCPTSDSEAVRLRGRWLTSVTHQWHWPEPNALLGFTLRPCRDIIPPLVTDVTYNSVMRRITRMGTCSTAFALNTHSHECVYKQRKATALMIITSLLFKLSGTCLDILHTIIKNWKFRQKWASQITTRFHELTYYWSVITQLKLFFLHKYLNTNITILEFKY